MVERFANPVYGEFGTNYTIYPDGPASQMDIGYYDGEWYCIQPVKYWERSDPIAIDLPKMLGPIKGVKDLGYFGYPEVFFSEKGLESYPPQFYRSPFVGGAHEGNSLQSDGTPMVYFYRFGWMLGPLGRKVGDAFYVMTFLDPPTTLTSYPHDHVILHHKVDEHGASLDPFDTDPLENVNGAHYILETHIYACPCLLKFDLVTKTWSEVARLGYDYQRIRPNKTSQFAPFPVRPFPYDGNCQSGLGGGPIYQANVGVPCLFCANQAGQLLFVWNSLELGRYYPTKSAKEEYWRHYYTDKSNPYANWESPQWVPPCRDPLVDGEPGLAFNESGAGGLAISEPCYTQSGFFSDYRGGDIERGWLSYISGSPQSFATSQPTSISNGEDACYSFFGACADRLGRFHIFYSNSAMIGRTMLHEGPFYNQHPDHPGWPYYNHYTYTGICHSCIGGGVQILENVVETSPIYHAQLVSEPVCFIDNGVEKVAIAFCLRSVIAITCELPPPTQIWIAIASTDEIALTERPPEVHGWTLQYLAGQPSITERTVWPFYDNAEIHTDYSGHRNRAVCLSVHNGNELHIYILENGEQFPKPAQVYERTYKDGVFSPNWVPIIKIKGDWFPADFRKVQVVNGMEIFWCTGGNLFREYDDVTFSREVVSLTGRAYGYIDSLVSVKV